VTVSVQKRTVPQEPARVEPTIEPAAPVVSTHVVEESYDGLVARVLRRPLRTMLDRALTDAAGYLKTEAETSSPNAS
jgi:hypothetical protein